jgi:hypothetical protein
MTRADTDGGRLTTAASVRGLRAAARHPTRWAQVDPRVKEALFLPEVKMRQLGGTLDDVFAALLTSIKTLAHPVNRALSRTMTPLDLVNQDLDLSLTQRAEADRARGRRATASPATARRAKATKADRRAEARITAIDEYMVQYPQKTRAAALDALAEQESTRLRERRTKGRIVAVTKARVTARAIEESIRRYRSRQKKRTR